LALGVLRVLGGEDSKRIVASYMLNVLSENTEQRLNHRTNDAPWSQRCAAAHPS
jgi:hypothetical protein